MKTLVKTLTWLLIVGCSASVQTPRGTDVDAGQSPVMIVDSGSVPLDAEEAPEVAEPEVESADIVEEVEEEAAAPQTLAEKFVAADGAGGIKLCTAMIYALSPDWNMDACDRMAEDETGRQAACYRQREPLKKFAEDICGAVIEESLRLDLDPALSIAVMERESSIGRVQFDSSTRTYEVQTDVCNLNLSASRVVKRDCLSGQTRCEQTCFDLSTDTRHCGSCDNSCGTGLLCVSGACVANCPSTDQTACHGTCRVLRRYQQCPARKPDRLEYITWTYGDDARQNRQRVIVTTENEDGSLTVNTCAAGETGLFQLLPANYGSGTVVEATGERLAGSTARRREQVLEDPILQVRLGCQELASHRDLAPETQRNDWIKWVHIYNSGQVEQGDHGRDYANRIAGHYLQACQNGWFELPPSDTNSMARTVTVKEAWPECARIEAARDALRD